MTKTERIQFPTQMWEFVFYHVGNAALEVHAEHVREPAYEPLAYLEDGECPDGKRLDIRAGATYRSLAYIGHLLGMDRETRAEWYEVAESVALSQEHDCMTRSE